MKELPGLPLRALPVPADPPFAGGLRPVPRGTTLASQEDKGKFRPKEPKGG
jgi:hypothetical protein